MRADMDDPDPDIISEILFLQYVLKTCRLLKVLINPKMPLAMPNAFWHRRSFSADDRKKSVWI